MKKRREKDEEKNTQRKGRNFEGEKSLSGYGVRDAVTITRLAGWCLGSHYFTEPATACAQLNG